MLQTADTNERHERINRFWAGEEMDRPLLQIYVKNHDFTAAPWQGSELTSKEKDESPEWQAYKAVNNLNQCTYYGEAVPIATPAHSDNIGYLPHLAGGVYEYQNGHAWVQPWHDVFNHDLPSFNPDHPSVVQMVESLKQIAAALPEESYAAPAPLGMDPLTTLSLFREGENFCFDLFDRRDEIKEWSAAFSKMFIELHAHMEQAIPANRSGYSSTWFNLAAPGSMEALQCDFAVMCSPEDFGDLALSWLQEQVDYFDYTLYHLDGTCQTRFFDQLQKLDGLNGIQWNPEPGEKENIEKWAPTFREIRERGWLLHINRWDVISVDNAVKIVEEVGPTGLSLALPVFDTIEEAEDALRRIEKASVQAKGLSSPLAC